MKRSLSLAAAALLAIVAMGPAPAQSQGNGSFNFDFRSVPLRVALQAVARRAGVKLGPMPSVPETPALGVQFDQVRPEQVWAALIKPYHLAYVDDPTTGLRYVGTEAEMAAEFPGTQVRETAALSYPGDLAQAGDLTRNLNDLLGPTASVFLDRREGTVVIVGSATQISQARQLFGAMRDAKPYTNGEYTTQTFHLQHLRVTEASTTLTAALGAIQAPDTLALASGSNSIIATGTADFISRVSALIASIDTAVPLMKLDVTVVALQPNNDSSDVGVGFGGVNVSGTPQQQSLQTTITRGTNVQINATLSAMVKKGTASVLSRGALYSRNNSESSLVSKTTYPYVQTNGFSSTVQTFDAGATIKMTPTFLASGIAVAVDASYSTLQGFSSSGIPVITTNESKDDLVLQDDSALVVSGFYSDVSSDTMTKIPGLGDLPLLGGFFREHQSSRVRSQIAFIMVPHKGSEADTLGESTTPIGFPPGYKLNMPILRPTPAPAGPQEARPLIGPHPHPSPSED